MTKVEEAAMAQSLEEQVAERLKKAIMDDDHQPWCEESDPLDCFLIDGDVNLIALARAAIQAAKDLA